MDLSIIVVNYNGEGYIQQCTDSIKRLGWGLSWEAIIVDNGSTDGSLEHIRAFEGSRGSFKVIENEKNMGFAYAANMGADRARGRFLLFLNPDTRIVDTNIFKLMDFYYQKARNMKVGAIGVKLTYPDGSLQHNARSFPTLARQFYESYFLYRVKGIHFLSSYFLSWWDHGSIRRVDWLSGAFLFMHRDAFFDAGGFDQRYFMYSEDADLCLTLSGMGYHNFYFPFFTARHADGAIASRDMGTRLSQVWASRTAYFNKHFGRFHAKVASLLYFLGMVNRMMLYAAAGKKDKASYHLGALRKYFKRHGR